MPQKPAAQNLSETVNDELGLNNSEPAKNENIADSTTKTLNTEPLPNGMLYGVLLNSGLMIKRGSSFVNMICCKQYSGEMPVQQGMWSVRTLQNCMGTCPMFGEPNFLPDGSATLTICDGRELKFNKLIDLRGHLEGINIATAARDEIVQYLVDNGIVVFQEE